MIIILQICLKTFALEPQIAFKVLIPHVRMFSVVLQCVKCRHDHIQLDFSLWRIKSIWSCSALFMDQCLQIKAIKLSFIYIYLYISIYIFIYIYIYECWEGLGARGEGDDRG